MLGAQVEQLIQLVRALFWRCFAPRLEGFVGVLDSFPSLLDAEFRAFADDLLLVGRVCGEAQADRVVSTADCCSLQEKED